MVDINYIPPILLDVARKDEFLEWIRRLPLPYSDLKQMILHWAEVVGYTMTRADYLRALPNEQFP